MKADSQRWARQQELGFERLRGRKVVLVEDLVIEVLREELESVIERARVDAVYVATPNDLHRDHTERAARAGAHVLCEKPMAPTVEDCEAMLRACQTANVRLMIAYRSHFEEASLRAIEIAQGGQIGKARLFTAWLTQQVKAGDIRARGELIRLFELEPEVVVQATRVVLLHHERIAAFSGLPATWLGSAGEITL